MATRNKWRVAQTLPLRPGLRLRPELQGGDFWWAGLNDLTVGTGQPQFESNEFGECFKGTNGPYFVFPQRVYAYDPGMTFILVGGAVTVAGQGHACGDTTTSANTISFKTSTGNFRIRMNGADNDWGGVDTSVPAVYFIQVEPSPGGVTRNVRLFRNGVQQGSPVSASGTTFTMNAIGKGSSSASLEMAGQLNAFIGVPNMVSTEFIEQVGDNPAKLFLEMSHVMVGSSGGDITPPTLSSPTATTTSGTTANGSVSTNDNTGTLYFYASTNATETGTTVKTSGSNQAVTTSGVQNVSFTGLTTNTTYYAHYLHRDPAGNDSTVSNSAAFSTDVTPPTLSSPVGTTTGSSTASGSVSTNDATGTLYFYASTNTTETGSTVKTSGSNQAVSATGTQNVAFTGLSPSTTYYAHYLHRDPAGNDSTVSNSASFTTDAAGDVTPPTLTGSITIGTVTETSIQLSWPAGSDNVAVTSYEVSKNAGSTWTDVGNVLTYTYTGLSQNTNYPLRVRAKDAASNVSSALSASQTTNADVAAPTMTGVITIGTVTSTSIQTSWTAGSDNLAVTSYEVSKDNGATFADVGNVTTYTHTSLTASTTYGLRVRAKDGAGNVSIALSASQTTAATSDTTNPTLTGSITVGTVTPTSIQMSWPSGSDNVAVTSYEVSKDSGSTYIDVGNVLTYTFGSLTPSTAYGLRVRAKDAATNVSSALSASQSTMASGTVVGEAIETPSGSIYATYTIPKVAFYKLSDLTVAALVLTNQNTNGSGILSITNSALIPGTAYLRVLCDATGANVGCRTYTAS